MEKQELDQLRDHYEWSFEKSHEWGLDPFPVDFHVVPADKMYEIASYGIPGHFSHWTYGRDYWRQKSSYDYGMSKIYELVINANPAQAFLMETNSIFENMFVISHVIGHSDFFARNAYFDHTNRRFDQTVTIFADRMRQFEVEHGRYIVEDFVDKVLTISHHIDRNLRIKSIDKDYQFAEEEDRYLDLFPEHQEVLDARRLAHENKIKYRRYPLEPTQDLLGWIAEHGDLEDWQREIVWAIREESLYFLPQIKTKIMNEGWASIVHRCMMHAADTDEDAGGFSFATLNSRVFGSSAGSLNPYVLGYNIFYDVIQHEGEHTDAEMSCFEFIGGKGWQKALEIVATDNDATFVSNYLSERVCEQMDLFEFGYEYANKHWLITQKEWEKVRDTLVGTLVDARIPQIAVVQGAPRRKLELKNMSFQDLNDIYTKNTLRAIGQLWGNDVILETVEDGVTMLYAYEDGQVTKKKL